MVIQGRLFARVWLAVLFCGVASVLWGQDVETGQSSEQLRATVLSPILTMDTERLFVDSAFGRRVARETDADGRRLAAENRRIFDEVAAEEQALTDQRATMDPEAFRLLADAFDAKVQGIRAEQDNKLRLLSQRQEADRVTFLTAAAPVLEALMREAGAALILERRTVFVSVNAIDVTDEAILRIDAAIGDGAELRAADPPVE